MTAQDATTKVASPFVTSRTATRLCIALLALLAAYFMLWPLWRLPFPIEIAQNEGWNAYHADAVLRGTPLYPDPSGLVVNNYPPLSFYLVALLVKLTGFDALYVGRALSIAATLGLGLMVARVVMQLGGKAAGGAIGGLWFVATMARSFSRFTGMNDPQLVGQFIMLCTLSWFISREKAGRSAVHPIALMALCGLYKHNIVAMPVTAMIRLAMADWRRAVTPAIIGAAVALLGIGLCVLAFGDVFLANMLTPRPLRLMRAVNGLGRLQWIAPALILWAIWAWQAKGTKAAGFTAVWIAVSFAVFLLQYAGEDILDNAQFDLVIASAVGLGMAFGRAGATVFGRRHGEAWARVVVAAVVVARLLATLRNEPFLILADPAYRAAFAEHAAFARADAAKVAAIAGPVACDLKLVCRMAGKPFAYDDFRADMILMLRQTKAATEKELAAERGLTYFESDPRAGIASLFRAWAGRP